MTPIVGIYKIENTQNHKVYVGQSVNIQVRWNAHRSELNRNKHGNDHLQKSWNKYGEDKFEFSILEECKKSSLNERETYWVRLFNEKLGKNNVYNLGHTSSKNTMSVEQRNKISVAKKKFYLEHPEALEQMRKNASGEKNAMFGIHGQEHPMYGKHHTEEARNKLRLCRLGTKQSEETKRKKSLKESGINNPMYGKHHTDEARRKMSEARKMMKMNDSTKQRISSSIRGRIWINNGTISKFIKKEELKKHIDSGWETGRIKKKGEKYARREKI